MGFVMRWPERALIDLFGIAHPIVQAPMAGASTPALAAAVSNAGALGGFGGTECSADELREVIRAIRRLTDKPFVVNLYLDRTEPYVAHPVREAALRRALAPAHLELNAGLVPEPVDVFGRFDGQLAVVIEERVPVLSTHFGAPAPSALSALKANGSRVIATANNVAEARELETAGVDAVIAQGSEAGGHRGGSFASSEPIGSFALVPQIVDAVDVPVIAAGGVMDGRGVAAALMLGASGVQMGTAFVACAEAAVNTAYVRRLLAAAAQDSVLTDALSGRPARVLRNSLVDLLNRNAALRLAFPEQLSMTRKLRDVAAATGNAEFMSLFAGQGVPLARTASAAELIASLVSEAGRLLAACTTS